MRAVILAFACGVALAATSVQAAPVPTKGTLMGLGATPSLDLELVRDGCGRGWKLMSDLARRLYRTR